MEIGFIAAIALLLLLVILVIVHMVRPAAAVIDTSPLQARLEAIERNQERVERSIVSVRGTPP